MKFVKISFFASVLFSFGVNAAAPDGFLKDSFRSAAGVSLGSYTHLKFPSWGDRTHFGNDVLANCGSTIYAPAKGVVIDVVKSGGVNFDSLGNAVIIKHTGAGQGGKDIFSLFLHMESTPNVTVSQAVSRDTVIGKVGKTGSANGICHSHVELRYFSQRFSSQYNNIYANGNVSSSSYAKANWENPNAFRFAAPADATPPKLSSPADKASIPVKYSSAFAWSKPSGTVSYRLLISQKSDFAGFKDNGDQSTCDGTCATYKLSDATYSRSFDKAGTYYWKVRSDVSGWSEIRSFSTK